MLLGENLLPIFKNILRILFGISLVYISFVLLFGEYLFEIIFGSEWILSGFYAKIIVFSFAIKFIISPILISLPAINSLRMDSAWKVLYFISIALLFFMTRLEFDYFLIVYTLIKLVLYLLGGYLVYHALKKYDMGRSNL